MGDVVAADGIFKFHGGLVVVATKTSNDAIKFADNALPIAWCWQCSMYLLDRCVAMLGLMTVLQQFSSGK